MAAARDADALQHLVIDLPEQVLFFIHLESRKVEIAGITTLSLPEIQNR
jgi:hypothetical protein